MKTIVYNMENLKKQTGVGLLPNYFKNVGIIVMLLALVPAAFIKGASIEISPAASKDVFRLLTINAFILGLLLVAWAKDKFEDERALTLRLKAMSLTFILTVLYAIIEPLVDILFNEPVADLKRQELVLGMLLTYLIIYYVQKNSKH